MKHVNLFSILLYCLFIELRSEYFTQLCRTCDERSPHFDIIQVQSLIHCAAVCKQTNGCKSVSFLKEIRSCKLYDFHASGCLGEADDDQITLSTKSSGGNCSLTTYDMFTSGQTPSIKTNCGSSYIVPPLVFEVQGSGASGLLVKDTWRHNQVQLMITNLPYRFANISFPGNEPKVKEVVLDGIDPDKWYRYWLMINKQQSGNMTVIFGKEEEVGCHVIYENSKIPEFTIRDIYALHTNGNWSIWTFLNME